ncbi:MAG: FadR family transcriptional regulator [Proteobacteria bacterium]|nr:FadR family transcriptional regulator [Pseudomonadota bacterium]
MNSQVVLKVVEKKRAYEDIVQQVIALIEQGKLKRGDQLPSERELTEAYKVSRTTVREAIRTLESMKLLQCRQGNGTFVLASNEEALIHPLAEGLFNAKDDIRDIFYIRKIIEPHVAQLAAENSTPQDIEKMEKILCMQEECIERGENIIETDSAFHNLVAGAAKNRVMERLIHALVDLLKQAREEYLTEGESNGRAKRSLVGHQQVLSAVRNGDSEDAKSAMLKHLEDIERIIFQSRGGGG